MTTKYAPKILSLFAIGALSFTAAPAYASETHDDSALPAAEIAKTEHGDDYVAVYPESGTPVNGEADVIELDGVDSDTRVIIANSRGELPMGLEADEIMDVYQHLEDHDLQSPDDPVEMGALLEEVGVGGPENITSEAPQDVPTLASHCFSFFSNAFGWSGPYVSNVAVFAGPGHRQFYRFFPSTGMTQQLIAGRGLGFLRSGTEGQRLERRFHDLGSAYTGQSTSGDVPWGNVAATPEFMARSVSTTGSGTWCH